MSSVALARPAQDTASREPAVPLRLLRICAAVARQGTVSHAAATLHLSPGAACLMLERRTWQRGALVTVVTIAYPGDRHAFIGRFSPTTGA